MSSLPPSTISGRRIRSDVQRGVHYELERQVGSGGMGSAYLARRVSDEGTSDVVVKLVRPGFSEVEISPEMVARKEAVALGRLNERVPPCPFVVRFVDTGSADLFGDVPTPWVAIEYVHGGVEGTTLEDRVTYSIHKTEYAFDERRAAHALRCLSSGLSAIHAEGIIHRDLTPGNVLCCGFGESEIFKISDFGLARPVGVGHTFAGLGLGTVGYAAPEQALNGERGVGFATDVFALSCVVFYLLTGNHYFDGETPLEAFDQMKNKARQSILASPLLAPELAQRPEATRAIDAALAWGTTFSAEHRPQSADALAGAILPWLWDRPAPPTSSRRMLHTMASLSPPKDVERFRWIVKHKPREDLVIQSSAWDTDGRCFALTPHGPLFWNGDSWLGAKGLLKRLPRGMSFARRHEAGGWLVGGSGGVLCVFGTEGIRMLEQAPDESVEFQDAAGVLDDLVVAVGRKRGEASPVLWAMSGRRWMKPLMLEGVQNVSRVLRVDDLRWIICGRLTRGGGFARQYEPMLGELTPLATPHTRAFVNGASSVERGLALVVGSGGTALRAAYGRTSISTVEGEPDLSAGAIDALDREWVASLGTLWTRDPANGEQWRSAWFDPLWTAPFVSLLADAGLVVGMTASGGIVEGRAA
ncbi:MAG TPA: serine/threonine-protein kinase [Polyangiaceae bacterium]|jgi:serine/threonine protein kinase